MPWRAQHKQCVSPSLNAFLTSPACLWHSAPSPIIVLYFHFSVYQPLSPPPVSIVLPLSSLSLNFFLIFFPSFISFSLKLLEECQNLQRGQIWAALHSCLLRCVEMDRLERRAEARDSCDRWEQGREEPTSAPVPSTLSLTSSHWRISISHALSFWCPFNTWSQPGSAMLWWAAFPLQGIPSLYCAE